MSLPHNDRFPHFVAAIMLAINMGMTAARQCYVCGEGSKDIFQHLTAGVEWDGNGQQPLESSTWNRCWDGESKWPSEGLVRECPEGYLGCLTQVSRGGGGDVMRTCDPLALNDCKTANGIQYCYCNEDLCNRHHQESDDEDYEDYSGMGPDQDSNQRSDDDEEEGGRGGGLATRSDKSDTDLHFRDDNKLSMPSSGANAQIMSKVVLNKYTLTLISILVRCTVVLC